MDNEHIYAVTQQLDHSLNRVLDDLRTLETYLQNIEARQIQMEQTLQRVDNHTR